MKKVIGRLNSKQDSWLFSKSLDLAFLFLPVWIVWIVFLSNGSYYQQLELPVWAWFIFILGIDVSHVWSSLFRTYSNKEEFTAHKTLLIIAPIILFVSSASLLYFSTQWFWRVMAYIAVFHFIKQQYGFLALYRYRKGQRNKRRISDKLLIYVATIYPVVYWHFNSHSRFNWFIENDFFPIDQWIGSEAVITSIFFALNCIYWIFIGTWVFQEVFQKDKEQVSTGKILWGLTTAINWWFGIVYFNSDLVFSISNVVAHGIPYILLICFYDLRKRKVKTKIQRNILPILKRIGFILLVIFAAAFVEEYFWDMLVYREHASIFERIFPYHWDQLNYTWSLSIAVAILALPQQVHYITDGFIWKMNAKNKYLKPIFTRDES